MDRDYPLLTKTDKGDSITYKGKYLYSKYNPIKGCEKIIETTTFKENTIYFIPSPILNYGLDNLYKKIPNNSQVLFIEIDKNLFDITLNKDCNYIKTGFEFHKILQNINMANIKNCELLSINGAYTLYKAKYDSLFNILINYIHNFWRNKLTMTKMGRLWIKNIFKNIENIQGAMDISKLKTDLPVVVIGAGESTEDTLQTLISNRKDIYILCVDTALQILLESGIKPNGVMALEGQFYNLPDFYGAKNLDVDLIFDITSFPGVVRNLKSRNYFTITEYHNDSLLLKSITSKVPNIQLLPPLGSVGITALYIAKQITRSNIYVAGLDFAYQIGKTHSRGTPYHLSALQNWNRIISGYNYKGCLNRPLLSTVGKSGNVEVSDKILYEYSLQAKELLFNEARIFDLTTKGMILDIEYRELDSSLKNIKDNTFKQTEGTLIQEVESDTNRQIANFLKKEVVKIEYIYDFLLTRKYLESEKELFTEKLKEISYLFLHFPDKNIYENINQVTVNRVILEIKRFLYTIGSTERF